jgi:hypothetical protein
VQSYRSSVVNSNQQMTDVFEEIEDSVFVSGNDGTSASHPEQQPMTCSCSPNPCGSSGAQQYLCCLTAKCANYQRLVECVDCHPNCGNNRFAMSLARVICVLTAFFLYRIRTKSHANIDVRDTVGKGKGASTV